MFLSISISVHGMETKLLTCLFCTNEICTSIVRGRYGQPPMLNVVNTWHMAFPQITVVIVEALLSPQVSRGLRIAVVSWSGIEIIVSSWSKIEDYRREFVEGRGEVETLRVKCSDRLP